MIGMALFTWLIAYLELEYYNLSQDNYIKNLGIMHSLLSFVISMLLVFRTNTAYDRWWEGRKLWGTLVNNSRNLAMKINAMLPAEEKHHRDFYKATIAIYASALAQHLKTERTRLALDEKEHPELIAVDNNKHVPNQVASQMFHYTNKLYEEKKITGDQLIIINGELVSFTDVCGGCERIKNTPIPLSYSAFLKKFIFIFVLTLPFSLVFSLGYVSIPVVVFIFYVLTSLEIIAEEIEDPFGGDENDLPTMKIADNIRKHVAEIL